MDLSPDNMYMYRKEWFERNIYIIQALAEMRYRISFLLLRRSAIITMPYYILRDQNWANSAGRFSWGGGSIFQWSWDHFFQDQDARHIWVLLELYYIGNQLAAINSV